MGDAMRLDDELLSVTAALDRAGIDYSLCGGLALAAHGFARATVDIDLLVRREDVARVRETVARMGYNLPADSMTVRTGREGETRVHRVSRAEGEEVLTLDLIEVEPSWEDVWRGRIRVGFEGAVLKVVSREGLIRMKRLSDRPQDRADLERLEEKDRS